MKRVVIVGGGPKSYIPDLQEFSCTDCIWIGADQGAEVLVEQGITPDIAIGDFDSVTEESLKEIKNRSHRIHIYPNEKDETDLELAINEALKEQPEHILLFGVTGGRMDHSQANIQLLYPLMQRNIKSTLIDRQNQVELVSAGMHKLVSDKRYPYISFLPVTLEVEDLTLQGFYYPLEKAYVPFGSTLCISNRLIEDTGTFSFESGILLVIRSTDLPIRG
ncbi:thiamine diphosphokinase [Halobacillus karajensis]|uniref:Thiamine diphosphokinase n=1 Tax=Halobacillus karajensis TaxID=195088 RepID=A0A024P2V1_9BACI|nr:thiamine diphosphokinase [Halobacillus karajensis]CDQ19796.1 Thiamine pyrophosphokinase [Halobacillus karajensis]CDQ22256.1 Thiamine pyrophosphokinase [Halobacillus karajensis]CDQ28097.1 Thiamine pyrophosphokinase [Halobacillus karajensis]SEH72012.1 thiamine diphosphokinase [Halobacillus karajensis]